MSEKQASDKTNEARTRLEILQGVSNELIGKVVVLWRTYSDTDQGKSAKIEKAAMIHRMVIDALRFEPDIRKIAELEKLGLEVREELDAARKVHPISNRTEGTEQTATA